MPASLLRRRCALTAPFHPYPVAGAVCSLWHFPSVGLEPDVPDVIRHTALRSSDFPPLASEDARSGRPVRLPTTQLYDAVFRLPTSLARRRPSIAVLAPTEADKLAGSQILPVRRAGGRIAEAESPIHEHSRSHSRGAAVAMGEQIAFRADLAGRCDWRGSGDCGRNVRVGD